jgi:putative glycosyltransferase (TIGR04348 family)
VKAHQPHVIIISPSLAKANNGNWRSAHRWSNFLRSAYRVSCATQWPALTTHKDGASSNTSTFESPALMIALHARRSAQAVAAYASCFPQRPIILVLTGTDLYRDIVTDTDAQRSLQLATKLVVLQPAAIANLSAELQSKTQIIYQSSASNFSMLESRVPNRRRYFTAIMIGHLRAEKRPLDFMQAAALVTTPTVRLIQVGSAIDTKFGEQAQRTQMTVMRYQWLGGLPHPATQRWLKRSDLLVICSEMEGGANVIVEAVTKGVPVIASNIPGNRGMLGEEYAGYFALGNVVDLAAMIERCANDRQFYSVLKKQCAERAALFAPELEQAAVRRLVDNCLSASTEFLP